MHIKAKDGKNYLVDGGGKIDYDLDVYKRQDLSAAKDTVFYCAHQSDIVEAAVFPELLVFDGNDGIDHVFRNLIIFQNLSLIHIYGLAVAKFLQGHDKVAWVKYCGLEGDDDYELAQKYLPDGSCGVVSFGVKGGRAAAEDFMQKLKVAAIETHVAVSYTHLKR